ncbi:MAG TPA: hypothetical protein VG318_14165, partial [Actinomycetota bacterium]|nr:hypothetical protein [Actinomycetota bacterium]
FGYGLDPHDSTYHVTFDATDTEAAEALEARLGDLVTIDYGEVELRGRMDDGEPHWGGAGIRPYGTSFPTCTAGFTVRYPSGTKGSVTAGHCYAHGTRIYSGPQFYGKVDTSHHPLYDMDRINPAGEVFENKIHVDPCCPSVRRVTGRSNPSLHEFLCVSGMKTRAVCGIEVVSLSWRVCTSEACNLLFLARKPGQLVGQGGDSGAPSYTRPSPSTATIKGMEVAGTRYDNFLGEKVGVIEARLGVTVATY